MANDLGDIFSSFGCFDDTTDVPSLFDNLDTLNLPIPDAESSIEPNSPGFADEIMSLSSPCSTRSSVSEETLSLTTYPDHSYSHHVHDGDKQNPVMSGAVFPEDERSPSPGGSLSSEQEESGDLLLYLMNETGVSVSEKVECAAAEKQQQSSSQTCKAKGKKRHLSDEYDDGTDKSRKNAIAARENRLKKKRYVEGLEKQNKALSSENARLHKNNEEMESRVSELEAEVDYLKSVLYNQSALSELLQKLGPVSEVRLSSSFHSRKQPLQKELFKPTSGGVCLHVNGKDASLEFCSQCALMAEGGLQQELRKAH